MKNYEVLNLINGGILAITANDIDSAGAYKVLKFKKALKNAQKSIVDGERACIAEVGITNPAEFDEKRETLNNAKFLTDEQRKEQEELNTKFERFAALREKLYNDESPLDGVKTIPYDQWHTLQKENKELRWQGETTNLLNNPYIEDLLEGVLWASPEEETPSDK